MPLLAEIMRYL